MDDKNGENYDEFLVESPMCERRSACTWCTEVPEFVRELRSQAAVVGQTVQFVVSVNAIPPASLTWLVNGFALSGLCRQPSFFHYAK